MQSYCMYSGLLQHGATVCGYPSSEGIDLMIMDFTALCQRHRQLNSNPYPKHGGPSEALHVFATGNIFVRFHLQISR